MDHEASTIVKKFAEARNKFKEAQHAYDEVGDKLGEMVLMGKIKFGDKVQLDTGVEVTIVDNFAEMKTVYRPAAMRRVDISAKGR